MENSAANAKVLFVGGELNGEEINVDIETLSEYTTFSRIDTDKKLRYIRRQWYDGERFYYVYLAYGMSEAQAQPIVNAYIERLRNG